MTVFGVSPHELRDRWRVGYVPQRPRIAPDLPATVEEVVATGRLAKQGWWRRRRAADRDAVDHALQAVALTEHRRKRLHELSGGQQQRALIARALAADPELLVLDEPIAGVDVESQQLFRDSLVHLVQEHHAAVLLVSHELGAVADDLDHVIVLKRRVLFDGPPADLVGRRRAASACTATTSRSGSRSSCDGDAAEAWPEAGTPERNRPDVTEMQRRRGRRPGRRSGIDPT